VEAFAPAKVNLYLHVGPPGADGFHPLCSLAVFADVGDRLTAARAARFSYTAEGPFAGGLGGEDDLVMRAVDALRREAGTERPALTLRLHKALPVASGLGGGTGDGAAALRLLHAEAFPELPLEAVERAAGALGSDGPACLAGRSVVMEGRGERLSPAPELPPLWAVLVNPGAPCSTSAVYAAYDAAGAGGSADQVEAPALRTTRDVATWLAAETRNDLQAVAVKVQPLVHDALSALAKAPETLLARMSGSGATCFALVEDSAAAGRLAERIATRRANWWVRACRLGEGV